VVQNLKMAENSVFSFSKLFAWHSCEKTSEWRKAIKCRIFSVR